VNKIIGKLTVDLSLTFYGRLIMLNPLIHSDYLLDQVFQPCGDIDLNTRVDPSTAFDTG